jgi:hypothetical protein
MRRHGNFAEANVVRLTLTVADSIVAMDAGMNGRWCAAMGTAAGMAWRLVRLMLLGMLLPTLGMDMFG